VNSEKLAVAANSSRNNERGLKFPYTVYTVHTVQECVWADNELFPVRSPGRHCTQICTVHILTFFSLGSEGYQNMSYKKVP
jgi:hypothetical protein